MAGRMGGKRVTQVGLVVHEVDAERNLLLVKGAVPGPKNGIVEIREDTNRGRSPKAPVLDAASRREDVSLDEAVFAAEVKPHLVHETVRAELNAHRAGTSRHEEPRARRRRPREAVAPEGHRPRARRARSARRSSRAAASRSRR